MRPDIDIPANLTQAQERIQAAARRAGRKPAEVTLVGVTKTYPIEMTQVAYQAGLRHFGENRVEEGRSNLTTKGCTGNWLSPAHGSPPVISLTALTRLS